MTENDETLPLDPDQTVIREAAKPSTAGITLPERIGRYRPVSILGRGGMGLVYEAEQDEPRRRVALKVIRSEMATDDLRRRFAQESVFLGRLQHPGIAQIYEAGTADTDEGPLPFIAMELVDGLPLGTWIEKHRPDRRTRLELMIRLCDAVHHAHQRGLIHRDLKPANILIDDRSHPRVLDFGVARPADTDLEASQVTYHGQIIGTVAYMSPEQLVGDPTDLDTRSDIYALGVILYELLAGSSPLALNDRNLEDALRAIREEEPQPLDSLDPGLRGDLAVITATAMAKDRDQRYASANGLAMDLQRHLDDEPIAARSPGTVYLMRKFARRHRPLVIGISGVAVALVIGVIASTWQAVRATRAEQMAATRLEQAETVTDFLQEMLAAVQPEEARGQEVTVSEVLDRAAKDLDGGSLTHQPLVEAALRRTLGVTYSSLGDFDNSEHHLQQGLALADSVLEPAAPQRLQLAVDVARSAVYQGELDRAAAGINRELERIPRESALRARALTVLADVNYAEGHWDAADSLLQRAQGIAEAVASADSLELVTVLLTRAFVLNEKGRQEEADDLVSRVETIYRQQYGDDDPRMISILLKRGDSLRDQGRFLDAIEIQEQALAIADAAYPDHHPKRADLLWRLGIVRSALREAEAAETAFLEALEIRRQVLGPEHRDIALVIVSLARLHLSLRQYDEAEARYQEALAMRESLFGPVHVSVVASLSDLGSLARYRNQPARAESLQVDALQRLEQLPEYSGFLPGRITFELAMALQAQGRHPEAEIQFRASLEHQRQAFGSPHAETAQAISNLATSLFRQERKSEAADMMQESLEMVRDVGIQGRSLLSILSNTSFLMDDAGRHAAADTLHRESIALAIDLFGADSDEEANARGRYSANLSARELWTEAEAQGRLSYAGLVANLPDGDPRRATSVVNLVDALIGQGRMFEADSLLLAAETSLASLDQATPRQLQRMQDTREALDQVLVATP